MNRYKELFARVLVCLFVLLTGSCKDEAKSEGEESSQESEQGNGSSDADSDADSDGDADSDSASDADSDADSDSDSDSDSDTDGDDDDICDECGQFKGVDLLLVVDNSSSMQEEQEILATGFFTLINSLIYPVEEDTDTSPQANVRLAVVSSDMGLQYGEGGDTDGWPYNDHTSELSGCNERPRGDNGIFQSPAAETIRIESGQIACSQSGKQCPSEDWTCEDGKCVILDAGVDTCPGLKGDDSWTETSKDDEEPAFAKQVACMAQLDTEGCGIEQQLQAGLKGLKRRDQKGFIREGYLLAVIIISDEEDCSVKDKGLFSSEQWLDWNLLNTACTMPTKNEKEFLFDTMYFHDSLVDLKDGDEKAIVFAAIVGVPLAKSSGDNNCEGFGNNLGSCLDHPKMKYEKEYSEEYKTNLFRPACTRESGGKEVTSASPGRRYVKVAQAFDCHGYVYSICNPDWSPAMRAIADLLRTCIVW